MIASQICLHSILTCDYPHCVKIVRIRCFFGPHFPAFGLNTDQKNSEYGHFSRSTTFEIPCFSSTLVCQFEKLYLRQTIVNAFSQNKKLSEEAIKKPIHNTKNNIYGNVIRYPFISKPSSFCSTCCRKYWEALKSNVTLARNWLIFHENIWDAFRDSSPFAQFQKREKQSRSATLSKLANWSLELY